MANIDKALHQLHSSLATTRQRERAILDNLAEIVCAVDDDLRFSDLNPAVSKAWGYNAADLLGKRVSDYIHKEDQKAAIKAFRDAAQAGGEDNPVQLTAKVNRANGSVVDTVWTITLLGWSRSYCCVIKDVSARAPDPDSISEVVAIPEKIAPAQQLLLPLVQATVESLSGQAQKNRLTVGVYIDPKIEAFFDREGLTRVITSLLTNAYKASPPSGQVRVVAVPTEGAESGYVRIAVIDQGAGIPQAAQARIFEQQNAGGGGSGLYACKAIVELHRGQIGIKSSEGSGSTFWFTIPTRPF